jgi:hypothetical protein
MKKILIVWALSREINIVKEEIKKLGLKNVKTSFLTTWMWNYNMILNLTKFLENHDFDIVLNIWVCWYRNDFKKFIQVSRIKNLSNNKELIIPKIIDFWDLESIAASEKVVYDANEIWEEKFIDMESYGFEMVCDSFNLPRIIIKIPVDKIWEETKKFDFKKAENNLRVNLDYSNLFVKIIDYVENHFQVWKGKYKVHYDEIDILKQHFGFTFSETEIFKRIYFRYIALVNKDFNSYFEENKNDNKKKFLKKLEAFIQDYLVR